jgi:hypothetical protein
MKMLAVKKAIQKKIESEAEAKARRQAAQRARRAIVRALPKPEYVGDKQHERDLEYARKHKIERPAHGVTVHHCL